MRIVRDNRSPGRPGRCREYCIGNGNSRSFEHPGLNRDLCGERDELQLRALDLYDPESGGCCIGLPCVDVRELGQREGCNESFGFPSLDL